jgi:peptide subunit release factor RF-3
LTEALALHARVITEAGAVHGKAGRRATVSDWMEMERARGVSITSTVLQFPYRTCAPISLESLPYRVARIVDPADAEFMDKQVSSEVLTRTDGVMLVLFSTPWRLEGFQRDNPDVKLGSLVAAEG